ncbi:hypothetical protein IFM89_026359 [Coptis chinensis]|uniref:RING-type E3 ubiquitin transferase n=1 Tax=Coptis chinensis TaxID=261450 RepID=A0A835HNV5_9MAGN|nr:hypothetical protein IFM89_026359 [Coptis chinensis]
MGNACCAVHPNANLHKHAYSVSGDRTAVSRRSNSSVVPAQSANRLGNPVSSSIHGNLGSNIVIENRIIDLTNFPAFINQKPFAAGVIAQRVRDEHLTTPNKIQRPHTEDQQVARVTGAANANQADELNIQTTHDERLITRVHTQDQQVARVTTATSTNEADEPRLSSVHDAARDSAEELSPVFLNYPTAPDVECQVAPVTTTATANQADEPTHIIASNKEENRFYENNLEADDACKESKRSDLLPPPTMEDEDRDECPICLDDYDEENPQIVPECKHHYHLGCILEWMERSNTCPVCNKV